MKNFLFVLLFIFNIVYINNQERPYGDYDNYIYNFQYGNYNNLNIISISYELSYNDYSVVKVIIKTYDEIAYNVNFNAYLKSDDQDTQYLLNCSNTFYDTIEYLS